MNEDNPPMVLPNGYVYSTKALQAQGEDVTCPRTGKTFAIAACRKAFIS